MTQKLEFDVTVRGSTHHASATIDGIAITRRRLWEQLAASSQSRLTLSEIIASVPFGQAFFEMPPLDSSTLQHVAEFVIVDAPLRRSADASPFATHLSGEEPVVVFTNLGGDATLVVPRQISEDADYSYLLSFLRTAPALQIDAFWEAAACAVLERVNENPVWVSTSGGGVSWLHLRLDDRPKYYTHAPYRRARPLGQRPSGS